jgi:hypothetical protein
MCDEFPRDCLIIFTEKEIEMKFTTDTFTRKTGAALPRHELQPSDW